MIFKVDIASLIDKRLQESLTKIEERLKGVKTEEEKVKGATKSTTQEYNKTYQKIVEMGCVFIRHGRKHDWYQSSKTKISQPIPRHREINEKLAKHIIKMLGKEV